MLYRNWDLYTTLVYIVIMQAVYKRIVIVVLGLCFCVSVPVLAMNTIQHSEEQVYSKIKNTLRCLYNNFIHYYYVDVHTKDNLGMTPLHWAARENKLRAIKIFLSRGADIQSRTNTDDTPLHEAAESNAREAVMLLLTKGANRESKDDEKWTPLHLASFWDNREIIALLLSHGADIRSRDMLGYTPLHIASCYNRLKSFVLLIDNGADIESKTDKQETSLDMALRNQHKEVAQVLLERGAVSRDTDGSTISHRAAQEGDVALIELLFAANASAALGSKDNRGYGFLYYALENLKSEDADTQQKARQIVDIVVKNKH